VDSHNGVEVTLDLLVTGVHWGKVPTSNRDALCSTKTAVGSIDELFEFRELFRIRGRLTTKW
jgi:hypothetical protein